MAFLAVIAVSSCATPQAESVTPIDPEPSPVPTVDSEFTPIPIAPQGTRNFAIDLVSGIGSTIITCNKVAKNTPHINWTCAAFENGLNAFIESWEKLEASTLFAQRHTYNATSEWMIFAIDGEIDFYWKTYELIGTQALLTFDPSEKGSEIIIGLNTTIGTNIAESPGSQKLTSESRKLPIQK